jgi:hypothetical protein
MLNFNKLAGLQHAARVRRVYDTAMARGHINLIPPCVRVPECIYSLF